MAKCIISTGWGFEWQGSYEDRFDIVLIHTLEQLKAMVPGIRGNPARRSELECQLKDRMEQLGFHCDICDMRIFEIQKGKRFMIVNDEGAEYVVTEDQLDCVID